MDFKVGLVGCGNIFPVHAYSLLNTKGVQLSAVCDIKPERARSAGRKYGCPFYTDYAEMLETEKLDSVHILTPHYLHPSLTIQALKRRINVLTEKPVSIDPKDAERMIRSARDNGVKLGVILQNRYNPGSQLVKKALEKGTLGKINSAKLVLSYHKPDSFYRESDWKGRLATEGGGVLIDQAIHFVDILLWLFDDEVDFVEANTARRMHKFIEVEDMAEGVIGFKHGGYACFYLINFYSYDSDPEIEMDCTMGRVKIVKDWACIRLNNGRKMEAHPDPSDYIDYGVKGKDYWGHCHYVQIKEYYKSLRRGEEPQINGEEGLKIQRVVWNIYKSAKLGKRIYL